MVAVIGRSQAVERLLQLSQRVRPNHHCVEPLVEPQGVSCEQSTGTVHELASGLTGQVPYRLLAEDGVE